VIVDLVSSGKTLAANDLIPVDLVSEISSRLVVNKSSLKINSERIKPLIDKFNLAVKS
jgi:ATP phosphoribosyltransferase